MLAFTPVEIAEVCLPFEAAEWVALGRVPPLLLSEHLVEMRDDLRSLMDGDEIEPSPYAQGELAALGIEVDYGEYLELFYSCGFESVDELFNGDVTISPWRFQGPPKPEIYDEVAFLERIYDVVRPAMKRGELTVLLALVEGKLTARGYKVPEGWSVDLDGNWSCENNEDADARDLEEIAVVQDIPSAMWLDLEAPWNVGEGGKHVSGFLGAWIDVAQLMKVFPEPNLPPRQTSGRRYGETLLVDESTVRQSVRTAPAKRGRPKKGDGVIELAVHAEFKRRARAGEIPEKKEALI